jgi:hypothetical protein
VLCITIYRPELNNLRICPIKWLRKVPLLFMRILKLILTCAHFFRFHGAEVLNESYIVCFVAVGQPYLRVSNRETELYSGRSFC